MLDHRWGPRGGVCIKMTCIPKKLLHHAALLGELKSDQMSSGWKINPDKPHDWQATQ